MTEVTPQAQGKAAALSAYLARGGTPFKTSGRFAKGPMKGKNVDEATADFEWMWATSPDSVKQKYASRSSGATTDLAPSERKVQGVTPAPLQGTAQSRRMAFYGHEMGPDGVARKIGAVSPAPKDSTQAGTSKIVQSPPAPKTPTAPAPGSDGKSAVTFNTLNQIPEGEVQYVGNANPDGSRKPEPSELEGSYNPALESQFPGVQSPDYKASVPVSTNPAQANNPDAANRMFPGLKVTPPLAKSVPSPVERTPIRKAIDGVLDANTRFWDRTTKAVNNTVAYPFRPASESQVISEENAASQARSQSANAANAAAEKKSAEANVERLRKEKGMAPAAPQAPAPLTVATRPPMSPARPMALLPDPTVQGITRPEAPTGKAVMTRPERDTARSQIKGSVNRLTGLPGGYLPGDALPQGADATMQQRANDSTARQSINTADAMPPRAVPVTRPTPMPGVEQRAANEMRRQAGINANPSTVNQDDPRKFFTGKVKPLDQLVKTQRVQGITPPRR